MVRYVNERCLKCGEWGFSETNRISCGKRCVIELSGKMFLIEENIGLEKRFVS